MTNTEAIETLRANYPDACFEQLREAVDAAIVALKAQNTSGDTISRQAAIKAVRKLYINEPKINNDYAYNMGIDEADDAIRGLPSAERREVQSSECEYWDDESNFCTLNRPSAERRGRWVFNIDDKGWSWDKPYMCDQCGEWVEKVFKFCPNCGAKMEATK